MINCHRFMTLRHQGRFIVRRVRLGQSNLLFVSVHPGLLDNLQGLALSEPYTKTYPLDSRLRIRPSDRGKIESTEYSVTESYFGLSEMVSSATKITYRSPSMIEWRVQYPVMVHVIAYFFHDTLRMLFLTYLNLCSLFSCARDHTVPERPRSKAQRQFRTLSNAKDYARQLMGAQRLQGAYWDLETTPPQVEDASGLRDSAHIVTGTYKSCGPICLSKACSNPKRGVDKTWTPFLDPLLDPSGKQIKVTMT